MDDHAAQRARWGCGGGEPRLRKPERDLLALVERTLALPDGACGGRCPFEGVYHPRVTGGHLGELLDARLLVADEHLSWQAALGREPVAIDVEGLRAFRYAMARLDAIRERQRARELEEKLKAK